MGQDEGVGAADGRSMTEGRIIAMRHLFPRSDWVQPRIGRTWMSMATLAAIKQPRGMRYRRGTSHGTVRRSSAPAAEKASALTCFLLKPFPARKRSSRPRHENREPPSASRVLMMSVW